MTVSSESSAVVAEVPDTFLWERRKPTPQRQIYQCSCWMLIISQIITQLLPSTASVISERKCQQETDKWPFVTVVHFFFVSSLEKRFFISVSLLVSALREWRGSWFFCFLLVNGILQILLQPLGVWVDANFPVALQLGTAGEESRIRGIRRCIPENYC